jgi:hypothetical protein
MWTLVLDVLSTLKSIGGAMMMMVSWEAIIISMIKTKFSIIDPLPRSAQAQVQTMAHTMRVRRKKRKDTHVCSNIFLMTVPKLNFYLRRGIFRLLLLAWSTRGEIYILGRHVCVWENHSKREKDPRRSRVRHCSSQQVNFISVLLLGQLSIISLFYVRACV